MFKTFDLGITFTTDSKDELVGYIDFDYTGLIDGRKSIIDYIFMLFDRPLFHQSKLQSTVTLLLYKAKYMIAIEVEKEAL